MDTSKAITDIMAGDLYRIAQGVENPQGAARETLVRLGLPVPPSSDSENRDSRGEQ